MAAVNPRVPVMLTPHQHDVLKRLAKAQGSSVSKIVGELVEAVIPPLERALALAEAAQKASDAVRSRLVESCEQAEQALLPILNEGMATMQRLEADFNQVADAVKPAAGGVASALRRGPARRRNAPQPPLVNKGVTPPSKPSLAPSRGRQRASKAAG